MSIQAYDDGWETNVEVACDRCGFVDWDLYDLGWQLTSCHPAADQDLCPSCVKSLSETPSIPPKGQDSDGR